MPIPADELAYETCTSMSIRGMPVETRALFRGAACLYEEYKLPNGCRLDAELFNMAVNPICLHGDDGKFDATSIEQSACLLHACTWTLGCLNNKRKLQLPDRPQPVEPGWVMFDSTNVDMGLVTAVDDEGQSATMLWFNRRCIEPGVKLLHLIAAVAPTQCMVDAFVPNDRDVDGKTTNSH